MNKIYTIMVRIGYLETLDADAPLGVSENSQFLRSTVKGQMAFSLSYPYNCMGDTLEYACLDCGYDPDGFWKMFIQSGLSRRCGKAGGG